MKTLTAEELRKVRETRDLLRECAIVNFREEKHEGLEMFQLLSEAVAQLRKVEAIMAVASWRGERNVESFPR